MSRLLYVDCVAGAAGDMLLAALIQSGADEEQVRSGLAGLGIEGLRLEVGDAERHGIRAATTTVQGPREHVHRTWRDVRAIIDSAALPERARARAHDAFARLAEAEGRVHGIAPDEVHFHEVGALDAIGEICGVALALESLGIDRVECSPLPVGRGFVDAAHGRLPLPAPATLELLRGAPIRGVDVEAELVTPTGAALLASLASAWGDVPGMTLGSVGYGAGTRDLDALPNVVRVLVGEPAAGAAAAPVTLIETNLDDMVPELVPDAAEALFAAGALDVWTTAAQMKKGRPGIVLSALARPAEEGAVATAMLRSTSTLGVRVADLRRHELDREWRAVDVDGHDVRVKVGLLGGEVVNVAPEHDDCATVARATGRSTRSVWEQALAEVRR